MPWHIAVTDACPIATPFGVIEDGTDKLVHARSRLPLG